MERRDTSDAQWKLIEPLLPKQKRGGKWNDHRLMFDGILRVLRTGAPWRGLPERYGKWPSVYHRFTRCKKDGTIDRILNVPTRQNGWGFARRSAPPAACRR